MTSEVSGPSIPSATYRLQLHRGFTFADVQALLPYLDDLGITDVYLSPVTAAVPGSMQFNQGTIGRQSSARLIDKRRLRHRTRNARISTGWLDVS